MSVEFRFHYFFLSLEPHPLVLHIYRMVLKKPKRERPMNPTDEEPTVQPSDLARGFKERTDNSLSNQLPENMDDLMRRLRERERRTNQ
jgi:hypothetical protein